MKMRIFVHTIFTAFMIFMIGFLIIDNCSNDIYVDSFNKEMQDKSYNYSRICIEGHIYFSSFSRVAIKLDNDGKPIKCYKK